MAQKIDFQDLAYRLQEELQDVVRIIQDKGPKHFQNAFAFAAGALLVSYGFVYRTTTSKLAALRMDIQNEQSKMTAASSYGDLKTQLLDYYARMPRP